MALHFQGWTQCQEFQVLILPIRAFRCCFVLCFSLGFDDLFNLMLSHVALSIIVMMSSTILKDDFEFIKAYRKSGIA